MLTFLLSAHFFSSDTGSSSFVYEICSHWFIVCRSILWFTFYFCIFSEIKDSWLGIFSDDISVICFFNELGSFLCIYAFLCVYAWNIYCCISVLANSDILGYLSCFCWYVTTFSTWGFLYIDPPSKRKKVFKV